MEIPHCPIHGDTAAIFSLSTAPEAQSEGGYIYDGINKYFIVSLSSRLVLS